MKTNPLLRATILEVVDNQLRDNNPPETSITFKRLISQGYSESEAKDLIGCVVVSEMFDILKSRKEFNPGRYRDALAKLPQLPWD
jgi:hypothetical protein